MAAEPTPLRALLFAAPEHASALRGLAATLQAHGGHAVVVDDVRQAAALAKSFVPSVLVVAAADARGLAVAITQLRTHAGTAALPVVGVAPRVALEHAVALLAAGLFAVLDEGEGVVAHEVAVGRAAAHGVLSSRVTRVVEHLKRRRATGRLVLIQGDLEVVFDVKGGALSGLRPGDAQVFQEAAGGSWTMRFKEVQPPPAAVEVEVDVAEQDLSGEIVVIADSEGQRFLKDLPPLQPADDATVRARLQKPRCLIAEDDEDLKRLYSQLLQRAGFEVLAASDGLEAYRGANAFRPDVVLSDIMMPVVNGWGLLSLLRDDPGVREARFVMLSFHKDLLEQLKQVDAGADDYLEKGARVEDVVDRVLFAVERRRALHAALLDPPAFCSGRVGELGVQGMLEALCASGARGVLSMHDGWQGAQVVFDQGAVHSVDVILGDVVVIDDEALVPLFNLEDAPFTFERLSTVGPPRLNQPYAALARPVRSKIRREREALRDHGLAEGKPLVFQPALLQAYRLQCADVAKDIVDGLAAGRSARDIMAQGEKSPELIDWIAKDLLRRGVATLVS